MKSNRMLYLCVSLALALAAEALALERRELIPQEASVVVRLSSAPGFFAALDRSPAGRLWRDPKVQDYLGKPPVGEALLRNIFVENRDKNATDATKEVHRLEFEMLKMLTGEVIFGFNPNATNSEPYILATIARTNYERSIVMDRRIGELKPGYLTISRSRFMDLDLYSCTRSVTNTGETDDEEADVVGRPVQAQPQTKVTKYWQCHVGQTLISAPEEKWVKATAARLLKDKPVEPAGVPEFTLRVDIPALIAAAGKENEARANARRMTQTGGDPNAAIQAPTPPNMAAILKGLGLGSVGILEAKIAMKASSFSIEAMLPIGEQRKGLLAMLDTTASSTALRVPFVSEQTVAYSVGRLDIASLWKAIPGMIAEIAPEPQAQFAFNAVINQIVAMLGIDLNADLFAHLGTQIVSVSNLQKSDLGQVFALELRNEGAFKASLDKIFVEGGQLRTLLGKRLSVERAGERTLYVFEGAAMGAGDEEETPPGLPAQQPTRIALTTGAGYFFWGNETAVRNVLQFMTAPERAARFYSGPLFQRLQRSIPKSAVNYEVTDCSQAVRTMLAALSEQEGVMAMFMESIRDSLNLEASRNDPAKLPSPGYIAAFFGPLVSYVEFQAGRMTIHMDGFYPEGR